MRKSLWGSTCVCCLHLTRGVVGHGGRWRPATGKGGQLRPAPHGLPTAQLHGSQPWAWCGQRGKHLPRLPGPGATTPRLGSAGPPGLSLGLDGRRPCSRNRRTGAPGPHSGRAGLWASCQAEPDRLRCPRASLCMACPSSAPHIRTPRGPCLPPPPCCASSSCQSRAIFPLTPEEAPPGEHPSRALLPAVCRKPAEPSSQVQSPRA